MLSKTKEQILQDHNFFCNEDTIEVVYSMMDEYAKNCSLGFVEYRDKFRREERRCFKMECERLGGIFSLADYGDENIYNDFINRKPIRSYIIPDQETFWSFNEKGNLIHTKQKQINMRGKEIISSDALWMQQFGRVKAYINYVTPDENTAGVVCEMRADDYGNFEQMPLLFKSRQMRDLLRRILNENKVSPELSSEITDLLTDL